MNERIKQLRLALKLSQDEFGRAIGLSKSGISNIESGTRNVNNKHIRMLVMSFNVNENWLLTGEGDMFNPVDNSTLATLKKEYNLTDLEAEIIRRYLDLSPSGREAFTKMLIAMTSNND